MARALLCSATIVAYPLGVMLLKLILTHGWHNTHRETEAFVISLGVVCVDNILLSKLFFTDRWLSTLLINVTMVAVCDALYALHISPWSEYM